MELTRLPQAGFKKIFLRTRASDVAKAMLDKSDGQVDLSLHPVVIPDLIRNLDSRFRGNDGSEDDSRVRGTKAIFRKVPT